MNANLSLLHTLTRGLSLLLLFPVAGFIILALITPISISGLLYLIGISAAAVGFWCSSWGYPQYRLMLWLGLGLIVGLPLRIGLPPTLAAVQQRNAACGMHLTPDKVVMLYQRQTDLTVYDEKIDNTELLADDLAERLAVWVG